MQDIGSRICRSPGGTTSTFIFTVMSSSSSRQALGIRGILPSKYNCENQALGPGAITASHCTKFTPSDNKTPRVTLLCNGRAPSRGIAAVKKKHNLKDYLLVVMSVWERGNHYSETIQKRKFKFKYIDVSIVYKSVQVDILYPTYSRVGFCELETPLICIY